MQRASVRSRGADLKRLVSFTRDVGPLIRDTATKRLRPHGARDVPPRSEWGHRRQPHAPANQQKPPMRHFPFPSTSFRKRTSRRRTPLLRPFLFPVTVLFVLDFGVRYDGREPPPPPLWKLRHKCASRSEADTLGPMNLRPRTCALARGNGFHLRASKQARRAMPFSGR